MHSGSTSTFSMVRRVRSANSQTTIYMVCNKKRSMIGCSRRVQLCYHHATMTACSNASRWSPPRQPHGREPSEALPLPTPHNSKLSNHSLVDGLKAMVHIPSRKETSSYCTVEFLRVSQSSAHRNVFARATLAAQPATRSIQRFVFGGKSVARGDKRSGMSFNVLGTVRRHPEEIPGIVEKRKKVSEKNRTDGDRLSASPSEATTSSSTDFFSIGTEVEMLPKNKFESTEEVLQEVHAKYVRSKEHENEEEASDTSLDPLEAPMNIAVSSVLSNRDACASTLQAFKFGVSHSRGSRPYMEDRYSIVATLRASGCGASDDGTFRSFCGIFDGHNGFKAAEYAARRIHQLISYQPCLVLPDPHPVDVKKALREAFLQTDSEILDRMKREGCRDGTTAVVCMRIGCLLYLGHVGDSRAVLCRQGVAYRLTTDHKPDLPQEKSRVHSVGGRVEFSGCWRVICEPKVDRPGSGLAVTRSLGDLDFKEPIRLVEAMPDVGHLPLQPVDQFVILGSDGLWDVITDQEAVDLVCSTVNDTRQQGRYPVGMNTRSGMAKAASDALVRAALKRGSLDNVTSLVILMEWS